MPSDIKTGAVLMTVIWSDLYTILSGEEAVLVQTIYINLSITCNSKTSKSILTQHLSSMFVYLISVTLELEHILLQTIIKQN